MSLGSRSNCPRRGSAMAWSWWIRPAWVRSRPRVRWKRWHTSALRSGLCPDRCGLHAHRGRFGHHSKLCTRRACRLPSCLARPTLSPADRVRASNYIAGHIYTQLGLNLPVHPVSVKQSIRLSWNAGWKRRFCVVWPPSRVGARVGEAKDRTLRESVETALKVRLERPTRAQRREFQPARRGCAVAPCGWPIRSGTRNLLEHYDGIRSFGDAGLPVAASRILEQWRQNSHAVAEIRSIVGILWATGREKAAWPSTRLDALAQDSRRLYRPLPKALDLQDVRVKANWVPF